MLLLMYNDKQASAEESQTPSSSSEVPLTSSSANGMQVDGNDDEGLTKEQKEDRRMHFMIHPSVDVDTGSSQP